jgi:hypothetical protein
MQLTKHVAVQIIAGQKICPSLSRRKISKTRKIPTHWIQAEARLSSNSARHKLIQHRYTP